MSEEAKVQIKGKYDMLTAKIESCEDFAVKIAHIKLLDQALVFEESHEDDNQYATKKEGIHRKYEELREQVRTQMEELEHPEVEIQDALLEYDLMEWVEVYAEIKGLLYRSGYYLEDIWQKMS